MLKIGDFSHCSFLGAAQSLDNGSSYQPRKAAVADTSNLYSISTLPSSRQIEQIVFWGREG